MMHSNFLGIIFKDGDRLCFIKNTYFFVVTKKPMKPVIGIAIGLYFIPVMFSAYLVLGLIDVLRNQPQSARHPAGGGGLGRGGGR